jgi:hypothetical protein
MVMELQELLKAAKNFVMSSDQREEQRRSFVFGNTNIENPRITREMVDKEAEALKNELCALHLQDRNRAKRRASAVFHDP